MARLTKLQSKVAGILFLALFFFVAIISSRETEPPIVQTEVDSDKTQTTSLSVEPDARPTLSTSSPQDTQKEEPEQGQVALQDFHRSETKDGRTVWEVWGSNAIFHPESNVITIQSGKLHFTNKEGQLIQITAGKAVLHLLNGSLTKAHTSDGVLLVHNKKVSLTAPEAIYDSTKNLVTAEGPVEIQHELISITGFDLIAHIDSEEMSLNRDVKSTVKPRGNKNLHSNQPL